MQMELGRACGNELVCVTLWEEYCEFVVKHVLGVQVSACMSCVGENVVVLASVLLGEQT